MAKKLLLVTTAMVAGFVFAASAEAGGRTAKVQRDAEIQELRARLERLEQQAEEDRRANQDAAVQEQSRLLKIEKTPVTLSNGRPCFNTNDNSFQACLRGRFQLDFADYEIDLGDLGGGIPAVQRDLGSGAVFRRARFGIEGRFFTDFIYEMRLDFGGTDSEGSAIINIARVGWAPASIPGFRVHAGAIQPILTMYDATSSAELNTIERAAVITTLVGTYGGDNGRRGIEASWMKQDFLYPGDNFLISGAFTGDRVDGNGVGHSPATTANVDDERTQIVGRLAYRFYSDAATNTNLQVGVSGAEILSLTGVAPGAPRNIRLRERPEIRVDGTRWIDTGDIPAEGGSAYGFEAAAQFQNFWIGGEWYRMDVDRDRDCTGCSLTAVDPSFSGWYVEGTWILTGEPKRYAAAATNNNAAVWTGPAVADPVGFAGGVGNGWGAWELTARYSVLDLDSDPTETTANGGIRGGKQAITNIGVNWYLNSNLKAVFEYAMVDVERSSTTALNGELDAEFDIVQGRMQFTF
jgi:phosphate-selective porin OprO/OprP